MAFGRLILDAIFPPRESELSVRSTTTETLFNLLSPTVLTGVSMGQSQAIYVLPYTNANVQACIIETKFHNNMQAGRLLAHTLKEYLRDLVSDSKALPNGMIILVPIPLSRARLRERGYNQTDRVAKLAVAGLETYIRVESDLIVRTRDTLPQTTLGGDARRQNIQGAFSVTRPCTPTHTYIVFDDVITTGATLAVAVEALKNAGAIHISALALAH